MSGIFVDTDMTDEMLKSVLTFDKLTIDTINSDTFSNELCQQIATNAKNSKYHGTTVSLSELDKELDVLKRYNPTLNINRFRDYIIKCSGVEFVDDRNTGSNFLLWTGVLGAMGVGLYLMTKGK